MSIPTQKSGQSGPLISESDTWMCQFLVPVSDVECNFPTEAEAVSPGHTVKLRYPEPNAKASLRTSPIGLSTPTPTPLDVSLEYCIDVYREICSAMDLDLVSFFQGGLWEVILFAYTTSKTAGECPKCQPSSARPTPRFQPDKPFGLLAAMSSALKTHRKVRNILFHKGIE